MNPGVLLSSTDRFALVIDGLWRAVAARSSARVMSEALLWLIWTRLRRTLVGVQALMMRFREGSLRFRARLSRGAVVRTGLGPPGSRMPRGFGWLLELVPYEAACFASQLRHLLADPEMAAALAATPRMERLLRPVCRMLGLEAGVLAPAAVPVSVTADEVEAVAEMVAVGSADVALPPVRSEGLGTDRVGPGLAPVTWRDFRS